MSHACSDRQHPLHRLPRIVLQIGRDGNGCLPGFKRGSDIGESDALHVRAKVTWPHEIGLRVENG